MTAQPMPQIQNAPGSTAVLDRNLSLDNQFGEPGDHDKFAHYVLKGAIAEAYILGTAAKALCGKVWVPNTDPTKFAVCPECTDLLKQKFGEGPSRPPAK